MLGFGPSGDFSIGQVAPGETVTVDKWFVALSEPARKRPALNPGELQFLAFDPQPFVPFAWFDALGEPVRTRPGLAPARQQFLAAPSQLRPNPNISGTLAATETKDTMIASVRVWNTVVSGETGITESAFTGAQIGVAVPVIARGRVAITIS